MNSDELPSLSVEQVINNDGGLLEIPNTGVTLEIPCGALHEEYQIKMRIITQYYLDESDPFANNSSVIVELLPSDIRLHLHAKLSLPHCLVFEKGLQPTAKIYSSHHEGTTPLWKEELDIHYELNERNCVMWVKSFTWFTDLIFGQHDKSIMLYATKHLSFEDTNPHIAIGYYWNIPGGDENIKLNVLETNSMMFKMTGSLPLVALFDKPELSMWESMTGNREEIPFETVANLKSHHTTFVLRMKKDTTVNAIWSCFFKAGQEEYLAPLVFPLTMPSVSHTELHSTPSRIVSSNRGHPSATGISLNKPVSESHLQKLSERIGNKWKNVARKLIINEAKIENIEKDYDKQEERSYQTLLEWKRTKARAVTYLELANAFHDIGRTDLQAYTQAMGEN